MISLQLETMRLDGYVQDAIKSIRLPIHSVFAMEQELLQLLEPCSYARMGVPLNLQTVLNAAAGV